MKFDINYIDEWNKKIIFAPNGFGKTTNSNLLKEELSKKSNVLYFTRKGISELVSTYNNKIFFGETAKLAAENENRLKQYQNENPLKKVLKEKYGTFSINSLKSRSLLFSLTSVKKIDDFNLVGYLNTKLLKIKEKAYSVSKAIEMDMILKKDIYEECNHILNSTEEILQTFEKQNSTVIKKDIYDYLEEINRYIRDNGFSECLLCGHKYDNDVELQNAITTKLKKIQILDENNINNKLINVCTLIINDFKKYNIMSSKIFDLAEMKIEEKLDLVKNYKIICESNNDILSDFFLSYTVSDERLKDVIDKYEKNNSAINFEKNNLENIAEFTGYLVNESKKIISSNYKLELKAKKNSLEVIMESDGKELDKSLYDVLSESEIKRFCLVVFKALIKYGKYDSLILDDPIDSYDDYYLIVACKYIREIVLDDKIKRWYILTNNFNALYNFSIEIKCYSIIYFENPNDIFSNSDDVKIMHCEINFTEIKLVNYNEIELMSEFLNNNLKVETNLAYVSFLVTLRNINSMIPKKYENIQIVKNGENNNFEIDKQFSADVTKYIEHSFMHYSTDDYEINVTENLKIKNTAELYKRIFGPKCDSILKDYYFNSDSIVDMRENVLNLEFSTIKEFILLHLILYKICCLSYLKYEFEKQLIVIMSSVFNYKQEDIMKIIGKNSLGKKINMAKEMIKNEKEEEFILKYDSIFMENQTLINLFDHGLQKMYPPYIVTDIKDLKKFYRQIIQLKEEFLV